MQRQRLVILGSTGSIGTSTLDVVSRHPDRFSVLGLSAHQRIDELIVQCLRWQPRWAVVPDEARARVVRDALRENGVATQVLSGARALSDMAADPEVDSVMAAIVGAAGLPPCSGRGPRGQTAAAGQQGGACRGRRAVHARGEGRRGDAAADRQRTFGAIFQSPAARTTTNGPTPSTTSSSPPRAGRFARATRPHCATSRPTRPAPTRTGSWAARSRSIRRR